MGPPHHGRKAYLLERNDALIIESFGVGGLPTYKAGDYYETVKAGAGDN